MMGLVDEMMRTEDDIRGNLKVLIRNSRIANYPPICMSTSYLE